MPISCEDIDEVQYKLTNMLFPWSMQMFLIKMIAQTWLIASHVDFTEFQSSDIKAHHILCLIHARTRSFMNL